MERNANDTFGNQNAGDATTGAGFGGTSGAGSQAGSQGTGASGTGGYGGSTGGTGTGGYGGTADASFSRETGTDGGVADRAREKLADAGSTVRDKAGNLKNSLADALESGAERLRRQAAGGGQTAGAAATGGSVGMVSEQPNRMTDMSNQVAGGLQGAADWLRDADLDGLKSGLERQVKEHPGRTLAVAVGVGYLLGKAIRK
ncbi:MAG: hypothetical protein DMD35_16120 [Gemmatimonadetes bacterium]|nr:MAG: hypothetical protein DMD35_16120 [Gemmatimonadota bacterium]